MKTREVTKEVFCEIFKQAMKEDTATDCQIGDLGELYETEIKIDAKIVIRDFLNETDHEFKRLEEAWETFQKTNNYSRVMAGNGIIYADYY